MLAIAAVSAAATLVSVVFAARAARAGADAVKASAEAVQEARLARADEEHRARIAQLERIADLIAQIAEAGMGALSSFGSPMEGARALERVLRGRQRLAAAVAATGLELPECSAFAHGPPEQAVQPTADKALAEVSERIAALEAARPVLHSAM